MRPRVSAAPPPPPASGAFWPLGLGLVGFLLVYYGIMAMPPGMTQLPSPPLIRFPTALPFVSLGALGLFVAAFGWKAPSDPIPDWGRWKSRLVLALLLGAAAWLRLKAWSVPIPGYWMDQAMSVIDARSAVDIPSARYLLFPEGNRPPFYEYLTGLVSLGIPQAPAFVLQNVVWALIDLTALWVHYLLGKELGGRRVGLILVALMAFSKPMLICCMTEQPPVTTSLALSLLLLFTFRFFKRPDLRRTLQLAVALAFGAYCYAAIRPFIWLVPMSALAFTLWPYRAKRDGAFWALGAGDFLGWTLLYLLANRFLSAGFLEFPLLGRPVLLAGLGLGWLFLYLRVVRRSGTSEGDQSLARTSTGFLVGALLMAPIASQPLFSDWANSFSIFNHESSFFPPGGLTLSYLAGRIPWTFKSLFIDLTDRSDMGLYGEAFFNCHLVAFVAVGLAWALARRSIRTNFLVLLALGGLAPHLLSFQSHTGRLMGALTPLLLLTALAVDAWLQGLGSLRGGRWLRGLAVLALAVWALVEIQAMDYRFYTVLPKTPTNHVLIYRQALSDAGRWRCYVLPTGDWCSTYTLSALVDRGPDLYEASLQGTAIPVPTGGKPPDVALYFNGTEPGLYDRVQRDFPGARLEETRQYYQLPNAGHGALVRAYIPGSELEKHRAGKPLPLLYLTDAPPDAWRRKYYEHLNGLGYGVIHHEDLVADPFSTPTLEIGLRPLVVEGVLHLPRDGSYVFSVITGNYAVLDVGGRRVLDLKPGPHETGAQTRAVALRAGAVPVRLRTYFQQGFGVPTVEIQSPGETREHPLGTD